MHTDLLLLLLKHRLDRRVALKAALRCLILLLAAHRARPTTLVTRVCQFCVIRSDNEYNKEEFRFFCSSNDIKLAVVAENDHESNGLIENASKTFRSSF